MKTLSTSYRRHRYPPQIISHAVWLYHRFSLSFCDVEDLLAQRGVEVSPEALFRVVLFGDYAAIYRRAGIDCSIQDTQRIRGNNEPIRIDVANTKRANNRTDTSL